MTDTLTLSSAAPVGPQRTEWIDVARGIGIVLVVYGHTLRGLIAGHAYPPTRTIALEDSVIYAFHMPLFFLLSGLFAGRSLDGQRMAFLRGRFLTIVYPYFLWSILQVVTSMAAGGHANRPGTLAQLVEIGWQPIGQFWFLYALLVCQLLLLLPRWAFYLMVPIGIVLAFIFGQSSIILGTGADLPYFALGVWLTAPGLATRLSTPSRAGLAAIVGMLVFAVLFLAARRIDLGDMAFFARFAVAAAGIATVLGIARLVAPYDRLLAALGRASMPIYLLHVIAGGAIRAGLAALHISFPVLALLTVTAGGLALPFIVFHLSVRLGISGWLGFGDGPRRATREGEATLAPAAT